MVRSIRFWTIAAEVVEKKGNSFFSATDFGEALFSAKGFDPYLEDIKTLWLLHWKFSTSNNPPLLAWDYLLNRWHEPEIAKSAVLRSFQSEAEKVNSKPSPTTLRDHFEIFIRTYVPTRSPKGRIKEDNLDSPLIELELLHKIGNREIHSYSGRREPIYNFRREEKPEISSELFIYCPSIFFIKNIQTNQRFRFAKYQLDMEVQAKYLNCRKVILGIVWKI